MLEAKAHGAAAVVAANVGGYSQIAEDALNSQDICGPVSIPTLSIGKKILWNCKRKFQKEK